jgi:hypothetical protein
MHGRGRSTTVKPCCACSCRVGRRAPVRWAALAIVALAPLGTLARTPARATGGRVSAMPRGGAPDSTPTLDDLLTPVVPPTPTSWIAQSIELRSHFRLAPATGLSLLERYENPALRRKPWHSYYFGRYGAQRWSAGTALAWLEGRSLSASFEPRELQGGSSPALALAPLPQEPAPSEGPPALPLWTRADAPVSERPWMGLSKIPDCPAWRTPRPVTLLRLDGERDRFELLDCRGAVAPEAIDRLSVMARPPGVPRPALPLPLDPQPPPESGDEWLPAIRLLHPRLVWLVQRFAREFHYRPITLVSGYRRDARSSPHRQGRALDLFIRGVDNRELMRLCRTLHDVGCGYYPNHSFIHVDVRAYGSQHPVWVDVSRPGEPSQYVDGWPGVVESGALRWAGED